MKVGKIVQIRHYPARAGVVLQVEQHAVHHVELPLLILVLHAHLIAVCLSYGAVFVSPRVPDVAVQIVNVVRFFLPDP